MKSTLSKEQLSEILITEGRVTRDQIKEFSEHGRKEKKSVFQYLMEKEVLKEDEMVDFLSEQLNIPTLNLNSLRVPKELIKIVPKKMAEKHQVFPLSRIRNMITMATCDPFDILVRDDLKEITKCDLTWVLATPKVIGQMIESSYGDASQIDQILEGIDDESLELISSDKQEKDVKGSPDSAKAGAEEAPVVRMVNAILAEAIKSRASDIHFEPYERSFRVRYRIDGALKETYAHSRELYNSLVARIKIMSNLNITERRIPQDGRFRAQIQGREIDFRVSVLPIYYGEKVVLRVLDRGGVRSGLENLGFSERPTSVFAEAIKQPYGMILVTGPTGSGKSTTLYTILNTLNTPSRNIMTIEDPVEYQIEGITQTQVHADVGLTFAGGLRSLLRQSPDIILVGEIRDTETADIAVKAALTGHLVFSTLHTNSAAGAMTRLMDMGLEPFLIASSVICVAAQRLIRRICQYCKEPYQVPDDVLRRAKIDASELEGVTVYRGKGCARCNKTGYFGRIGTIEVLKMDPEIRTLVLQRKSSDVIEKLAIEKGMETLFENALGLFKKGLTTLEEVLRVSSKGH